MTAATMTDLLTVLVRGGPVAPEALAACNPETFCRLAEDQGLVPLLSTRLPELEQAPVWLLDHLHASMRRQAVTDALRVADLRELVTALDAAGVCALLMKGGQLAYTHYPRPELRPRIDTDILIPAVSRPVVHDTLTRLGYESPPQVSRDLIMYQRPYLRHRSGARHVVDVHWRVANPQVFGALLSFEELAETAVPIAQLGPAARGLSDVHSLLVACVHRVAHHFDVDRLIWLYDIHLIAAGLYSDEWERFIDLANERGVAAVCRRSLRSARDRFNTAVPTAASEDASPATRAGHEMTASYLTPRRRHIAVVVEDLRALATWGERWRLLREHAFPSSEYMREVYAPSSATPLLWLYARRIVGGAQKWLRRP